MRIANLFLIPVIGIIFLYGCNRQAVALDYTNAKDEVPQLGNLTFRFNKPLVTDSLLNQWDSTEYVSFEPKIPAAFAGNILMNLFFLRPGHWLRLLPTKQNSAASC